MPYMRVGILQTLSEQYQVLTQKRGRLVGKSFFHAVHCMYSKDSFVLEFRQWLCSSDKSLPGTDAKKEEKGSALRDPLVDTRGRGARR